MKKALIISFIIFIFAALNISKADPYSGPGCCETCDECSGEISLCWSDFEDFVDDYAQNCACGSVVELTMVDCFNNG